MTLVSPSVSVSAARSVTWPLASVPRVSACTQPCWVDDGAVDIHASAVGRQAAQVQGLAGGLVDAHGQIRQAGVDQLHAGGRGQGHGRRQAR